MTLVLLLLKTLVVFAVSSLLLLILRRASASARHLVCLLTLVSLLALPLFSLTLPGWRLPVLKEPTLQEPTPARLGSPPLPKREEKEFQANLATTPPRLPAAGGPLRSEERTKQGGGFLTPPVLGAGGLLLALYTLGVLLALVRPLLGLRGIAHLRRLCVPVTDPPTLTLADDCAAVLPLTRPVTLCTAAVPVPMTWGWHWPVVLLPSGFTDWPSDRTQAVLLHEMAHVSRRDWLSHRFADLVCALYWFHPLVWLTARRLRAEGEIACDDLVLSSGIAAPDYARHLLDIARALPPSSRPTQSAIAMAQTSQIEGRLTMILDKTQSRRTLTRRVLIAAFAFGTVALVPLAMLKPMAKAQTAHSLATSLPSALLQPVVLSAPNIKLDGQPVLAGVTDSKGPGGKWWSASGVLLPKPVFDSADAYQHITTNRSPGQRSLSFAFRLPAAAQGVTVQYKVSQSTGCSSDGGEWPSGKSSSDAGWTEAQAFASTGGVRVMTAALPPTLKKTHLSVGIASGVWKTTAVETETPSALEHFGSTSAAAYESMFMLSSPVETANGLVLILSTNSTRDIRVVAIDKQGNTLFPTSGSSAGAGTLTQITAHFSESIAQIKEFCVETRPFQWIEFKNVALRPVQ